MLLEAGARRVYAVDVGFGQLRGSLRQDERVVVLERTNISALDTTLVPEPVAVITIDLSYLAVSVAVRQLDRLAFDAQADLIALVKPMFELRLGFAPSDPSSLDTAAARARSGLETGGWNVLGERSSPVPGARGAPELLVHARRTNSKD